MNPLLTGATQNSILQNLGTIKQAWGMLKSMGNPQAMMEQMLKNNPNVAEINKLIEANGGDVERAFRVKAEEMGVNPDEILKVLQ